MTNRDPVTLELKAVRANGDVNAVLEVSVEAGFHLYAPHSTEGIPLSVEVGKGFATKGAPQIPFSPDGHLSGKFEVNVPVTGQGDELELSVGYQACDFQMCLMPVERKVSCKVG